MKFEVYTKFEVNNFGDCGILKLAEAYLNLLSKITFHTIKYIYQFNLIKINTNMRIKIHDVSLTFSLFVFKYRSREATSGQFTTSLKTSHSYSFHINTFQIKRSKRRVFS